MSIPDSAFYLPPKPVYSRQNKIPFLKILMIRQWTSSSCIWWDAPAGDPGMRWERCFPWACHGQEHPHRREQCQVHHPSVQETLETAHPFPRALPLRPSDRSITGSFFETVHADPSDPEHPFPKTVGASTIEKWHHRYKKNGFEGLLPQTRKDEGVSRKLDQDLKSCWYTSSSAQILFLVASIASAIDWFNISLVSKSILISSSCTIRSPIWWLNCTKIWT